MNRKSKVTIGIIIVFSVGLLIFSLIPQYNFSSAIIPPVNVEGIIIP